MNSFFACRFILSFFFSGAVQLHSFFFSSGSGFLIQFCRGCFLSSFFLNQLKLFKARQLFISKIK